MAAQPTFLDDQMDVEASETSQSTAQVSASIPQGYVNDAQMVEASFASNSRAQFSATDIALGLDVPDYVSDEEVEQAIPLPPQCVYPTSRKEDKKRWKREKREAAERDGTAPPPVYTGRMARKKLRAREAALKKLIEDERTSATYIAFTQDLGEALVEMFTSVDEQEFLDDIEMVCGQLARWECEGR